MLRKITLITLTFCFAALAMNAQNNWSLEKCIQYAVQNNLSIKQAQYNTKNAELLLKQNQFSRLPNLNGNFNGNFQFGRNVNPVTNQAVSLNQFTNSVSLSSSVLLYNGNVITNSIKQSKVDLEATKLDGEASINNISLSIANAYLSILLAEESLENAEKRLEQSQKQLEQTDRLIQAGSLPKNDRLDFVAQIARDELAIIDAQNLITINYLNLKQLLQLDPTEELEIDRPQVIIPGDAAPELLDLNQVYSTALGTQPVVQASDLRIQSAELGESIAKANFIPSISLSAGVGSAYSNKDVAFFETPETQLVPNADRIRPVLINDVQSELTEFMVIGLREEKISYLDQLDNNFGQNIGFNISIPIYNRHSNRISLERARLNTLNSQVQNQQVRQQLKTDIQTAIANVRSAKESYEAAQTSLDAAEAAYDNAEKRFKLGVINTLEYTTARNNLDQAQVELIRSKYQYVFNLKIVDFYLGKPLKIK